MCVLPSAISFDLFLLGGAKTISGKSFKDKAAKPYAMCFGIDYGVGDAPKVSIEQLRVCTTNISS